VVPAASTKLRSFIRAPHTLRKLTDLHPTSIHTCTELILNPNDPLRIIYTTRSCLLPLVLSIMQQIPNSVSSSAMSTLSSSVVPIPSGQQQAPPSGASNISMKAMAPQQIPSSYTLQQQQQQKQSLPIRAYLDQTVVPLLLDGM
jgi:hypothetical protein